jgi:hypothetical protein
LKTKLHENSVKLDSATRLIIEWFRCVLFLLSFERQPAKRFTSRLTLELSEEHYQICVHAFSLPVGDEEQGWEERAGISLMYSLKTYLARSTKDAAGKGVSIVCCDVLVNTVDTVVLPPMELPSDTAKLKRHIAMLYERLNPKAKSRQKSQLSGVDMDASIRV